MDKTIFIFGVITLIIIIIYFLQSKSESNAMVIVEPRKHNMLKYVCMNFDKNMPKDWKMYVFHGKSSGAHAKDAVSEINGREVILSPLESDNFTADQYNQLFKDLNFWNKVEAENILVFQTDAVLCPASQYKIHDFMKYDYIGCGSYNGAIGNSRQVWGKNESANNSFYGVGGLSFRKNSFQKKCIRDYPGIDSKYPEDVFFSNCVEKSPNKPKEAVDLANFCTQDSFERKSFGAHKTWYMRDGHSEPFYKFCPAAREIKKE